MRRGGNPARRAGGRAAGAGAQPAGPEWVVSRSKQFRVAGGDSLLRGTVAMLAEETKDELLKLTGEKDEWKVPVTIRLHGKPGDPLPARTVSMRLLVVEGVSELGLDVHLSRGIEHGALQAGGHRRAALRAGVAQTPGAGDPDRAAACAAVAVRRPARSHRVAAQPE